MSGVESRPKRVLVIDDEVDLREVLALTLQFRDFDVSTAGSGQEALRLLESRPFDVVLSDVRMPGLDGLGLLREMKRLDLRAPVVLMSGYTDIRSDQAQRLGAVRLVVKPFDLEDMVQILESVLR